MNMKRPLYIAFVWHMHQPYYKDSLTAEIALPWARLHAVKDYLNMLEVLKNFPKIRQTFNLVPSLIDQLEDYSREQLPDEKFLQLSAKPAKDLTLEEKRFLVSNFFMANWGTMVMPLSRFYDLLLKRGKFLSPAYIDKVVNNFKTQDYLDLQVLFNLAWFDPTFRRNDKALSGLLNKGSKFSEEDKGAVIKRQVEIIKRVIPTYKAMQEEGQIEVSISPYYHPILPLLCDTDIAKIGMPKEKMPQKRFLHPEDAAWHVGNAVTRYEKVFNRRPNGMWPSEGSVSEDILPILIDNQVKWIATDEDILFRSTKRQRSAEIIYKPYLLKRDNGSLNIIFRDHNLSDLIGFTYQTLPPEKAVDDFISHLHRIRDALAPKEENFLVSIILDGENAWESYPNNGRDFLSLLYLRLSEEEPLLKTTTVSDFLKENPSYENIASLYPGSWINSNFSTWIGQEEKNIAWDYLSQTRAALVNFQKARPGLKGSEKLEMAWRQIYIAEGSDWNWWYGPQNNSSCDEEFDRIYRRHLSGVYEILGEAIPDNLKMPIVATAASPMRTSRGLMRPVIDGLDTTYYEWLEAFCYDVALSEGTMHRAESIIQKICCGFDLEKLFISISFKLPEVFQEEKKLIKLVIAKMPPSEARVEIPLSKIQQGVKAALYKKHNEGPWELIKEVDEIAFKKVLEIAVRFKDLGIKKGDEFKLAFFIEEDGLTIERQPQAGPIKLTCPTTDYEAYNWTA